MKEKLNVNQIPELKQAILDLTEKEKNQLLIRLINKDQVLIEQLHFKLLEDEFDLIKRFEDLKAQIKLFLKKNYKFIINAKINQSAKLYTRLIRNLSGEINHFSKVTKSTSYEVELRTILLIESSKLYKNVQNEDSVFGVKVRNYQVSRIKAIAKLFDKLHEDLKFDFLMNYSADLQLYVFKDLQLEIKINKVNIDMFING